MAATTIRASKEPNRSTSLPARILNMFACPGEVFDEVVSGPIAPANWFVPALLVGLSTLLAWSGNSTYLPTSAALGQIRDGGEAAGAQATVVFGDSRAFFSLVACLAALAGTF